MTDDEIIAVVQAHKEGKQIQSLSVYESDVPNHWLDVRFGEVVNQLPTSWDFTRFRYRVKPEPRKPREWTVVEVNGAIYSQYYLTFPQPDHKPFRVREVIE